MRIIVNMWIGGFVKDLEKLLLRAHFWLWNLILPARAAALAVRIFTRVQRVGRPPWEEALVNKMRRRVFSDGCVGYVGGESERKVLLVHGWAGRGTQLGYFANELMAQGFEVICLDGPAHGESPGSYTYPMHFALYLKGVVDELGGVDGVIAHSFGAGASALALRVGMQSKSIVYIGGLNAYQPVLEYFCRLVGIKGRARELFMQEGGYRNGGPIENLRVDRIQQLQGYPILLVHDYEDEEVPIAGVLELAKVLGCKTLFTKGLGHRRILRDPGVIKQSIEFISQV